MLLQDILKYKSRSGKPYHVESITVALKKAQIAKLVETNHYYDIGITLMGIQIAIDSGLMNKKKLEALGGSLKRMEEKFVKRILKSFGSFFFS